MDAAQNGGSGTGDLSVVLEALQAIYDASSSNDTRRRATEFLETAKRAPEALAQGRAIALDRAQPAHLRHYGLTMLEHSLKYRWEDFDNTEKEQLRGCVVELAQNIAEDDPVYLRNKVAQLWTEVAKRAWGAVAEWMDMDEQLSALWHNSLHHQAVALYVLETLSEEIFNREDPTAGLRGTDLGRAMVEIFTPAAVLAEHLPTRDQIAAVRFGDQGWLTRLCTNLDWSLSQDYENNERIRTCAVKTMNALRASMSWVIPKAIGSTHVVDHVCKALAVPVIELQLAAISVLQAIYSRHHIREEDMGELMAPILTPTSVALIREVYNWTLADMDVHDLNEQKYMLCKKISELTNSLGLFAEKKPSTIPEGSDIPAVLELLHTVASNPSLFVSIPALHCWTKLLKSSKARDNGMIPQMTQQLLEICCSRLIRYEALPEDTEDVTVLFLNEDLDTFPERHAFLGNYRRYCVEIIEFLVRKNPEEAMALVLQQATTAFQTLYNDQPPFRPESFSKHSIPALRVDAQVTILEAALRGYLKEPASTEVLDDTIEQWCQQLLQARFEDPEIVRKIIGFLSSVATKALAGRPDFAFTFLSHLFDLKLADSHDHIQYSDAVRDLERMCSLEMQKLAMKFPDQFIGVYERLEQKINEITATLDVADKRRSAFTAFLFIIIHRCSVLDRATQEAKLKPLLTQVRDMWQNDAFTSSMSSFQSFCGFLGMDRLPEFLTAHNFSAVQDWSEQGLPTEGKEMQAAIQRCSDQLPLRFTKTMLAASMEKLQDDSPAYAIAEALWGEAIPIILPNILQLVSHAQAFNDIDANWSNLPPELQQVIRRVLTDRFWQAGISTESRDDFFSRVSESKLTYEGFASTVRGTVRQIRESSYFILYTLSRFRDAFYGIPGLAGPLAQALFANASALSAHHLSVLLQVSTHIIEGCPARFRSQFLPPLISGLFRELTKKITSEWEAVNRQVAEQGENDNLTDEMKNESILRQLTSQSVTLVTVLLDRHPDPERSRVPAGEKSSTDTMPNYITMTPEVLEPILVFCNSILRVRDTRSVITTSNLLKTHLIPFFREKSPIRDFFCKDILMNAISSLHEPYFVDCQKDLASLIATIILLDDVIPKEIILSLPGMEDVGRVDRRLMRMRSVVAAHHRPANGETASVSVSDLSLGAKDDRLMRSIVLDLLEGVRGVGIHELGKIDLPIRKKKSAFRDMYMSVDDSAQSGQIVRGGEEELDGVAGMFGE